MEKIKKFWRIILYPLFKSNLKTYTGVQMIQREEIIRSKEDVIQAYKRKMVRDLVDKLIEDKRIEFNLVPNEDLWCVELRAKLHIF